MGYKNINFLTGTKFLVTGAAGFIGSNIVNALLNKGYKVRGIDNFSTGNIDNIQKHLSNPNFEFVEGDIRDFDTCKVICTNIDYVLHQAALGSVPRSMKQPLIYEENNVKGTANMMEAARISHVKRFIYASSSSVYGDSPNLPKVEGDEGNLLSPYALTKKINEEYGKLYTDIYGLECIGLRYFNVFGKHQNPNGAYAAVIPKFVSQLLVNDSPTINGDGEQSRDFTYIDNVIEANLKACLAPYEACGKSFNIAYGDRENLMDVYRKISTLLGKEITPIFGLNREGDIKHSIADISEARNLLDYHPEYDFTTGLELTIEWYKENLLGVKSY
ncbi:UDP-N-acetylglucosamine 4-epimerase [Bacillus niacini]|uniref:UDP-N-acetylglucosamine 4-epimerase n=1 Tax=Neobacillus niacini TaxID=86668 RepID=A0A852T7P3_9BACI|nr:SDR family oxidoreductase [Neobacillus niacini]NYE03856.1 UDP-N-acetylglucosamine 4-epimerase [Neobacillus niacini]